MELGARIKRYRKARRLTQLELAEKAFISRTYLADVEKDRYNPSLETLKAISKALQVGLHELLESRQSELDRLNLSDLEMEFEEVVNQMKIKVDGIGLTDDEVFEMVEYIRFRRIVKKKKRDLKK